MLHTIIQSEWFPVLMGFAAWLFLAISKKDVTSLLKHTKGLVQEPLAVTGDAIKNLSVEAGAGKRAARDVNDRFIRMLEAVIIKAQQAVIAMADQAYNHISSLLALCDLDGQYRVWRVIGMVTELIALVLFIYTDAAQAANSLATLFPTISVPPFLADLVIPLIVSSAGSIFIQGMILGDFMRLTHFSIWGEIDGRRRPMLITIVVINILLTIACSLLLSLNRFPAIVSAADVAQLPDTTSSWIFWLAAFSQSLIILPLLMTTLLLFRALTGLVPIYALIVLMLVAAFKLIGFCLDILRTIAVWGGITSAMALSITFFVLQAILGLLSGALLTSVSIGTKFDAVFDDLADAVTRPLSLVGQAVKYLTSRISWFTPPTVPSQVGELQAEVQAQKGSSGGAPDAGVPVLSNGQGSHDSAGPDMRREI